MKDAGRIFAKELREMVRDRRVLLNSLFGPIFLIVLMLGLFGFVGSELQRPKAQRLHIVHVEGGNAFVEALGKVEVLDVIPVPTWEEGRKLVAAGDALVVLRFVDDFDAALAAGRPARLEAVFDPDRPTSQIVVRALETVVQKLNRETLRAKLEAEGIDGALAEPLTLDAKPVEKDGGIGGLVASLLPYIIVIWAFYGGFGSAADVVAGEKERQTLETLLISPVSRTQIALGKFLGLLTVCMASSLASLLGVVLFGLAPARFASVLFPDGLRLGLDTFAAMLMVVVPLAAMFAAVLLAVSAAARNIRECQTQLTLLSFLVLMPAVFSQFIGFTDFATAGWIGWVPILNASVALQQAFQGQFRLDLVGPTATTSLVLAYAALVVAVRLFHREQVLIRI
ncbi:MAG: ABC transporter permease [Fimbriimonadaceae bacterium]